MRIPILSTGKKISTRKEFFKLVERIKQLRKTVEGENFLINIYAMLAYEQYDALPIFLEKLNEEGWLRSNKIDNDVSSIVLAMYKESMPGIITRASIIEMVRLSKGTPFLKQDGDELFEFYSNLAKRNPQTLRSLKENQRIPSKDIKAILDTLDILTENHEIEKEALQFIEENVSLEEDSSKQFSDDNTTLTNGIMVRRPQKPIADISILSD